MKRIVLLLLLFVSSVRAQNQAAIDPSFKHEDRLPMFNLNVTKTITQPDGKIVLVGPFDLQYKYNDLYANRLCSKIIRLNSNLTVDETFNSGLGFDSNHDYFDDVTCAELQTDGKLLVGGKFVLYNGATAHKIARLNPDGSRDNTFFSLDLFSSVNSFVQDIEIQPDQKILVAGYIESQFAIVRLNADGTVDSSFNMSSNLAINFADFHLMNNGKIVLVGSKLINATGDYQQIRYVFNNDGSLDSAVNIFTAPYTGMNKTYLLNDNKMMLCVTPGLGTNSHDYLMRINLDGTIDNTFNSGTGFSRNNGKAFLGEISFQANGDMVMAGSFTQYNGNPVRNRVRINSNGAFDPTFNNIMADNNDWLSYAKIQSDSRILACFFVNSPFDSVIRHSFLWLDSNGYIIDHQHLNTTTKVAKFVRKSNNELMVLGSSDFSFNWYQNGIKLLDENGDLVYNDYLKAPLNANYQTKNAIVQPDGKVLFIGKLPQNPTGTLMRFNTDFSTDSSFNLDASLTAMSFKELSLQADGKILVSYKSTISGTPNSRLVRLLSNGTIDTTFNSGQGCTDDTADIRGLAVQADGKIIVCGLFRTYNGVAQNGIVRLNTDGTIDNSFNMPRVISWHNHSISAMALQNDGKIVVGLPGGDGIYRLNPNGSIDSSFSCPIQIGGYSNAIALQPDGKLLIGGTYGYSASYPFYRVNTDGSIDTTFDVGTGFNDAVNAIFVEADGRIMIGGNFTKYNGTDCNGLVRLNGTATLSTIENEFDTDWVSVYPNPTSAVLNIVAKQNIEIESAEVYNLLGQFVLSVPDGEKPTNLDVSRMPSGHYILKVRTKKGVTTKKFIKL